MPTAGSLSSRPGGRSRAPSASYCSPFPRPIFAARFRRQPGFGRGAAAAQAASPAGSKATAPRLARWDELQLGSLETIARERGWSVDRARLLEASIQQDLANQPLPDFGGGRALRLSASGVEDYLKCPFIFAAKRLFGLSDLPSLDLDVDALARGRLMHALFERLVKEPFLRTGSAEKPSAKEMDGEIEGAIEAAREAMEMRLADERLWPSLKARHLELGRRFLAHEREWRRRFPETKTVGTEAPVRGYVSLESGELFPEPPVDASGALAPAFAFAGSIDRIDVDDHGHAAILDYKSTEYELSSFGAWIQKDRLQLLLYAAAFERGLTSIPPRPVANMAYFAAKTMNRDWGLKLNDVEQGLFEIADRKRNQANSEQKAALFRAASEAVRAAAQAMRAGQFQPRPKDRKTCETCRWSKACRAPHLNS